MEVRDVTQIKIDQLSVDDKNPNVMTDEQMDQLRSSMDKYGFLFPIIVDQNNKVVDGEHRFLVMKERGMVDIPCIKMKFKNEAERRALRQATNKIHGHHDLAKDIEELDFILKQDSKLLDELLGMNEKHIDDMKKSLSLIKPQFHAPSESDEDVSKIMKDMDIKRVIHIPVSEELSLKLKQIMEDNDINDYEELLEFLVGQL